MPKKNKDRMLKVRFNDDELRTVDCAAAMSGRTRSQYVRDCCLSDDASAIEALYDNYERLKREGEARKRRPRLDDFPPNVHTRKSPFDGIPLLPEDADSLSDRVIIEPMRHRGEPKLNRVSIRVTDYEWKALHYRARLCETTLTNYILAKAVYEQNGFGATDISVSKSELKQIRDELRKQGANLNQIARSVNILSQLQQRDDVDAEIIETLTRNLMEDNQQTRALINDALIKVTNALALIEPKRK